MRARRSSRRRTLVGQKCFGACGVDTTSIRTQRPARRGQVVESSTLQKAARIVGIVFLLVGVLGFIPGITQNYGDMKFAGNSSDAELFGVFQVSILHNIVHLLFGIAGIALSRTWEGSRNFLIGGGAFYLLLWLVGVLGAMGWLPGGGPRDTPAP